MCCNKQPTSCFTRKSRSIYLICSELYNYQFSSNHIVVVVQYELRIFIIPDYGHHALVEI